MMRLPCIVEKSRALCKGLSFQSPSLSRGFKSGDSLMMQKGQVASRGPMKIRLEAGKQYNWCACGLSSKQPFCDGSHKNSPHGILPAAFRPSETKDYIFCCCKQTNRQPICDGSHKKL